jgi:acyl-CoA reductase-like NAD-dependent aldehyde dehydrogenase
LLPRFNIISKTSFDPYISLTACPGSQGDQIIDSERNIHTIRCDAIKMNGIKTNGVNNSSKLSEPQLLYINGQNVPSSKDTIFPVTNPMTGEVIYQCSSASADDYKNAIYSAHKAFNTWSQTPPSARRLIFLKAADILETYLSPNADAAEILSAEVSATKSWVQLNIKASAGVLRESAGLLSHIKGEIGAADRPGTTIMVLRVAVGVVFAISPWNAPVSIHPRLSIL